MKLSAFPIIIELEVLEEGVWIIVLSYRVNSINLLYIKMANIKSMYVLDEKNYRIMLTLNSKVNNYVEKERGK